MIIERLGMSGVKAAIMQISKINSVKQDGISFIE
jgi:hypothetical protein